MLLESALYNATSFFSTDYDAATRRFAQHANKAHLAAKYLTYVHPLPSPGSEALRCETVWLGSLDASRILILNSGTHGVEGFCGSAIQSFILGLLNEDGLTLPNNSAILFIHALNPWGMAWARRCDEQGIDLNRNFVDFATLPTENPYYAQIVQQLENSPPEQGAGLLQQFSEKIGSQAFDIAFSSGQYTTPWAPYFGGTNKAFGRQTSEAIVDDYSLTGRELVVLDLHTGLGPFGYGELICDHPSDSAGVDYAQRVFGSSVAVTAKGESFSRPKHGLLDYFWHQLMQQSGCFLTLEFGTYAIDSLFSTVLHDHLHWRQQPPATLSDANYRLTREAMLKHFLPQDFLWQQSVLIRSWQLCTRVFNFWQN